MKKDDYIKECNILDVIHNVWKSVSPLQQGMYKISIYFVEFILNLSAHLE